MSQENIIKNNINQITAKLNEIKDIDIKINKIKNITKKQTENLVFYGKEHLEDEELNNTYSDFDKYDNLSLIELNSIKIKYKKEIIKLVEEIFNFNKTNLSTNEKDLINIIFYIILEEIVDFNNYKTLEKIINIKNLDRKKIIKFAKIQANLAKLKKINKNIKNIENLLYKNINLNFQSTFFMFLIFLYFKNLK